jgi:hypothetical protein
LAEGRTYAGGCHCGNVKFEVTMDLKEVMECNCSICSKTGALLTFVAPERFRLLAGRDRLSDYQEGVDPSTLTVRAFDGRSL